MKSKQACMNYKYINHCNNPSAGHCRENKECGCAFISKLVLVTISNYLLEKLMCIGSHYSSV